MFFRIKLILDSCGTCADYKVLKLLDLESGGGDFVVPKIVEVKAFFYCF